MVFCFSIWYIVANQLFHFFLGHVKCPKFTIVNFNYIVHVKSCNAAVISPTYFWSCTYLGLGHFMLKNSCCLPFIAVEGSCENFNRRMHIFREDISPRRRHVHIPKDNFKKWQFTLSQSMYFYTLCFTEQRRHTLSISMKS